MRPDFSLSHLIIVRRVIGHSMMPTFKPGQLVVASCLKKYRVGESVIAEHAEKEIVKRVVMIDKNWVRLAGDNAGDSTDIDTTPQAIRATLLWS